LAIAKADDEVSWERQMLLKTPTNNIALTDLERQARFGVVSAQTDLGMKYFFGDGVSQDFSKGIFWLQQSAAEGSIIAESVIAEAFYTGDGVNKNSTISGIIFLKLANEGMPKAQETVGWDFLTAGLHNQESSLPETEIQNNYVQAYKWVEIARLSGVDAAKLRSEIMEEINKPSLALAQKLAAEFKPKSPTPLRVTTEGFSVQPIPWLKWQASNDLAFAQFNLGLRYFKGDGIETNQSSALVWIGKSAAQNYQPAVEFLKTNSTNSNANQ
jgi:uncharacterized protein